MAKSNVHHYVDDANELVDLGIQTILDRLAAFGRERIAAAADARGALSALVRMFMGKVPIPVAIEDATFFSSYIAHAWRRGAHPAAIRCLDTITVLFEEALARGPVVDVEWRARSIHHYLLGVLQRRVVDPVPEAEVAAAVSALSGIRLDPVDLLSEMGPIDKPEVR